MDWLEIAKRLTYKVIELKVKNISDGEVLFPVVVEERQNDKRPPFWQDRRQCTRFRRVLEIFAGIYSSAVESRNQGSGAITRT
jgi:hypothetical protein